MSTDSYIEVSSPPTGDNDKWINGEWVECCLIDKTSKKYIGIGDNRTSANTEYAPNTLLPEPFEASKYAWNGISWEISLEDAKVCKKTGLRRKQSTEINLTLGDIANLEVMSFTTQESEARKWLVDNTANTPFVDGLLNARANGETKQDLCNKILFKADAYATIYSAQLGRFHKLIKAVDLAMSVKEVKAVVWN